VSDTIKIDQELKKRIEALVRRGEYKIEFPSVKNFVDKAVLRYLKELEKDDKNK